MENTGMKVVDTGKGWYDVENADGSKVNTKALRKEDAEKLASAERPNRNSQRRERVSYGQMRNRLGLDAATKKRIKEMGLVERWVNDDGGRLQELHGRGYDFFSVDGTEIVGDQDGDFKSPSGGSHRKEYVGTDKTGKPMYAYLMVTAAENYKEDAEAKEGINNQIDDAIKGGTSVGLKDSTVKASQGSTSVKDVQYKP